MNRNETVAVVGAGIVGLSTALWLQRSGYRVTLIDRQEPGLGTSFGNAGVFADYARLPMASFKQLRQIPGMLLDKESPLSVQPQYAKQLIPYGWSFLKSCTPEKYRQGCEALTSIQVLAPAADAVLLDQTGSNDLVRRSGSLALFSTREGFDAALQGHLKERQEQGVNIRRLSVEEVNELEPDLAAFHAGGVLYPDTRYTVSPIELSRRYARHFAAQGGRLLQDEIVALTDADQACSVQTTQGTTQFDRVVICAGVAGANLAAQLGVRFPLVSERGYHLMLEVDAWRLGRPVAWLDKATFLTPMEGGIRVAGMAEFAAPDAPQGKDQTELMLKNAEHMIGRTPTVKSSWVGSRPSTPDSLPVIGPVPAHPRFVLAFGHGHLGLTLSAVTGKLVAESMLDDRHAPLLAAFSPARFS